MTRLLSLVLIAAVAVMSVSAKRNVTTRKGLKTEYDFGVHEQEAAPDTIWPQKGDFGVYGYEKAQSATSESFFVTNNTSTTVSALVVTITYYNTRGDLLHRRSAEKVACDIPPGETRKIDIRAWDKQKLWYYKHSQARHNAYSTPFDVKVQIDYAL